MMEADEVKDTPPPTPLSPPDVLVGVLALSPWRPLLHIASNPRLSGSFHSDQGRGRSQAGVVGLLLKNNNNNNIKKHALYTLRAA